MEITALSWTAFRTLSGVGDIQDFYWEKEKEKKKI